MKKIYSLLLFTIIGLYSTGQSIVISTNLWSNIMALEPTGYLLTEKIRFTTDTTINLISYKLVERTLDSSQVNWSRYGFIREDSDKRVYYKTDASGPDYLIYALNLAIGDSIMVYGVNTINFSVFIDSAMYHVTSTDSIEIGSTYMKQLHLSGNVGGTMMEAAQWVDSMGGMSGILHNWNMKVGEDGYGLLCFEQNGILKYHNTFYTDCYVTTGIESPGSPGVSVSVSPNPVTDISIVRINGIKEQSGIVVRIYNSMGENVITKSGSTEFFLRNEETPAGIYILTVQYAGEIAAPMKIIFQ